MLAQRARFAFAGASRIAGHRCIVARAAQERTGVVKVLQDQVAGKFAKSAQGSPPNISTAQMVQMFFELGVADVKTQSVGDIVNYLTEHGFYCKTNPSKKDSYGVMPPPTVGLRESQRWATLLLMRRLGPTAHSLPRKAAPKAPQATRPPCVAVNCRCPAGSCILMQMKKK
ncbi:unnamed protein product [Effrenium voratum]|uniref:Uncharacterized protein n=1 Tax=Effrenium voratum TaxID=2562239 RepID=A0AA36J252_9DINO|nr:unnamed protein product [Effrenium voratum]CAJ1450358.1 unnamed protein product [Effrenium voratum]|mmetsp:Transcript_17093/g.40459  ORF Transcript_17093/g.40459 Transcript_17093/m.40459 type:complete len:171 (-) Transcript_17093:111-623(-)